MRAKFVLARRLNRKIEAILCAEHRQVYQRYLFSPEANVSVLSSPDFAFSNGMYNDQRLHRYRGSFRFSKHYLGADAVPAFDGNEGGEEFKCAQTVDSLREVRYWLRNVSQHPKSFWLPLAQGKFYPDFVALLEDERLLVVEYKGAHLANMPETNEKRTVGHLWEQASSGRGLFLTVEREKNGKDVRDQLLNKIRR
jgi:type III restriction enzyme